MKLIALITVFAATTASFGSSFFATSRLEVTWSLHGPVGCSITSVTSSNWDPFWTPRQDDRHRVFEDADRVQIGPAADTAVLRAGSEGRAVPENDYDEGMEVTAAHLNFALGGIVRSPARIDLVCTWEASGFARMEGPRSNAYAWSRSAWYPNTEAHVYADGTMLKGPITNTLSITVPALGESATADLWVSAGGWAIERPVPEPACMATLGLGLAIAARKKRLG